MCDLSESVIYQEIFQKGVKDARRQIPLRVMESRLGPLSATAHEHFDVLVLDDLQITALFDAIPDFKSEQDVLGWIKHNITPMPRCNKPLISTQSANKNGFASAKKKSN